MNIVGGGMSGNGNTRELYRLFPTVVQTTTVAGHEALNARLLEEIDDVRESTPNGRPESWSCDVYTTISNNFQLHQRDGFARLAELFLEHMSGFANTMKYSMTHNRIVIDMCWLNVYGKSHSQERHTHINYAFSGIYYVKAPKKCSKLILHSPVADTMIVPKYKQTNDLNSYFMEIEPEEGLMVIFHSYLPHGVGVSTIDEERISIAVNANLVPN